MSRVASLIFSLFFLIPAAYGIEHGELGFLLGSDLRNFNYSEYDAQGKLLDRESGLLPGLLLGIDRSWEAWQIAGQFTYHNGSVRYTGQTNTGAPISTTTQQQISGIELKAGYRFPQWQQIDSGLYLGMAKHAWKRNIQPTFTAMGTPVRGLLENYCWGQFFLGARITRNVAPSFDWGLDMRLSRIFSPEIGIDYLGLYDNLQLKLGERMGYKVSLPMFYSIHRSTEMTIEPYMEKYAFGRSQSALLTSSGNPVGTAFEPDSTSTHYGILLGVRIYY